MWTPLAHVKEEGWVHPDAEPIPPKEERELGPRPNGMKPTDFMILGKLFENKNYSEIGREMGLAPLTVKKRIHRPAFQSQIQIVEAAIVERIARGEFGALAIAKANAVGAMRRIVGQARRADDERVKFQANVKLLEYAGIQPAKPPVTESVDRLIDMMTADEAETFARTGEFPERFRDQLARLATSVLEAHERKRWTPKLESLLPGEDPSSEPHREPPTEIEEGELT